MRWSHSKQEQNELLAVVDWNQKLSFYQLCGKQVVYGDGQSVQQLALIPKVGKDRHLGFDASDISWFGPRNETVAVCGSNRQCLLFSSEGNRLADLTKQSSWIWCCRTRPNENQIVIGCQDGTLETVQLLLPVVHSLYRDRYAYRESLTDVIVQHLVTEQKARIKCRDYVKKIAVYKSRLAIQLSDKILVYEPATEDSTDMHYRVREKLIKNIECQLLIVTTHNLVICQDNVLTSLNFQGTKERQWNMSGPVRYIRIVGGPPTRETLLIGLKTGQVMKIILDNAFPIQLAKALSGIRCVDISRNQDKLGVIDDNNTLSVFCQKTNDLLFQEPNVTSLAWNTLNNDLLSYSGNDRISIKAGNFSSYSQHAKGVAVGFSGCYIYCLQENVVHRIEVSLSPVMYLYLDAGLLNRAREIACFGLTEPEWLSLGQAALAKLNLPVSKYAYIQLGDAVMLTFIQQLEERCRHGDWSMNETILSPGTLITLGDVAAYMRRFSDAAAYYTKAGTEHEGTHRAVEMYTDLRRFDEAREAMTTGDADSAERRRLIAKHADWAKTTKEHRTAAKMYLDAGEFAKAIELAGENRWTDLLLEISRKLDKGDRDCLGRCAQHLARLGEYAFAADCYAKYGDVENQLALHVEAKSWEEAFELVKKFPEHFKHVYLPYAHWLAENDKFEEAQAAFAKAGLQSEAIRVLERLATCAANESRFEDAAFYHWKLSMQCLDMVTDAKDSRRQQALLTKFYELQKKADIYYVYANIHRYLHEPFAFQMPETYFNMARYLVHLLQTEELNAISKAAVLYVLARHGQSLGAYKLARLVYERLRNLHLPKDMREKVELASLSIRTRPYVDSEDIHVMCYRCSTTNPLISTAGNRCTNCREPFVYSFISLEQLPLVEFVPEEGLSHEKVIELLRAEPQIGVHAKGKPSMFNQGDDDPQMLKISHDKSGLSAGQDRFTAKLLSSDLFSGSYTPVQLDAETLGTLSSPEVIIINYAAPLHPRYYKSLLPEVSITQCNACHKVSRLVVCRSQSA
ncbi:Intraflagellar transport protein [Fasciolopsis buskii]|uniref:Intraflagellar transport protein n=1 Tax=Fasciolopsis buskii TaxID=27845 RepID=A0A8E0RPT7_9TREM|nr:Intraflagellar transport protein [Fasciolopsis buski]